jgi:hypothetical protein
MGFAFQNRLSGRTRRVFSFWILRGNVFFMLLMENALEFAAAAASSRSSAANA